MTWKQAEAIVDELKLTMQLLSEEEVKTFIEHVNSARRVFVAGVGRSGFIGRCFAMRLMHLGIPTYVVGEAVTPSLEKDDLLIICSGSGETKSLVAMSNTAKKLKANVGVVTIHPNSTIGIEADFSITIHASTPKSKLDNGSSSIQPMGSLFEQSMLIIFDSIILSVMNIKGLSANSMYGRHANLE